MIARHLAAGAIGSRRGRPRQAELRRAISATYYALFHALARCCADTLVGKTRSLRSQPAWRQTYRALEHGHARNQCSNRSVLSEFPSQIQAFAQRFIDMQRQRHFADYDPEADLYRSEVIRAIDETERAITGLEDADIKHRRAFSVLVLLRLRRD